MKPLIMTPAQVARLQHTLALISNAEQWQAFLAQVHALADEQTVRDIAALEQRTREKPLSDSSVLTEITAILEAGLTRKWMDRYLTGFLVGQDFDPAKPGH